MKERPILFSAPMVRALLDGSKTQTRRVINPQPEWVYEPSNYKMQVGGQLVSSRGREWLHWKGKRIAEKNDPRCPYGQPGDRLWVRETWQGPLLTDGDEFEAYRENPDDFKNPAHCEYAADGGPKPEFMTDEDELVCRWRPSIFMPRWASRITLEIVSVRVERLQDISEADAMAEGADCEIHTVDTSNMPKGCAIVSESYREGYRQLWDSINGPGSWESNPWVWVVEFRRVTE